MENNNELDDLFKSLIEPYEMVHSEKVWESLENRLDKKSNDRNKIIIFRLRVTIVSLLLLFGSVGLHYFLNSNSTQNEAYLYKKITLDKTQNDHTQKKSNISKLNRIRLEKKNGGKTNTSFNSSIPPNKNKFTSQKISLKINKGNSFREKLKTNHKIDNLLSIKKIDSSTYFTNNKNDFDKYIGKLQLLDLRLLCSSQRYFNSIIEQKNIGLSKIDSSSNFSLSIYFSPDYTRKYTNQNYGDQNDGNYESEMPDFSFNSGFVIGYDLSKNWGVKIGGTYTQLVQTIKPRTIYASLGNDGEVHYKFNTSYGSSELPNRFNTIPNLGDSLIINSNSLQSIRVISLPVVLNYQITRNKFSYYAQFGLSINFLAGEKLVISSPTIQEKIKNIEGLQEQYLGGILGLGVSYKLTRNISFLLEPTFRSALTPISKDPVSNYPLSLGINLGCKWHF